MKRRTRGLAGSNKILPVLLLKGNLMTISKITLAAALAARALVATPALAQDAPAAGLTVTASATIVSASRFRGLSLSARDAPRQNGFGVTPDSGFYVGTRGSGR